MRIVSDIQGIEGVAPPGTLVATFSRESFSSRWPRNFRLLNAAIHADYLVIHFSLPEVLFFAVLLFLIPLQRCRLVTLDFFVLSPPAWLQPLVRWSLAHTYKMLVYFRDSSRFQRIYDLPAEKFQYVPFKINQWESVRKTEVRDEQYLFVGGRSRRDFKTLFEAVRDLPFPVKILTGRESDINPHGSSLKGLTPPPNVTIFYDDADTQFFLRLMAGARLVVLPILKGSTIQAGIAVYLAAMALHKCVIISEAPGVNDVLLDGQACIVPPGNVAALRCAIEILWNDERLRQQYADAGYSYAIPLGGEDELRRSVLRAIHAAA